MKTRIPHAVLFLCLATNTLYLHAEQGTLRECQRIKDKIDYYTNLKRAGGSAKQMAYWHKRRNRYKAKYSSNSCTKYKKELE